MEALGEDSESAVVDLRGLTRRDADRLVARGFLGEAFELEGVGGEFDADPAFDGDPVQIYEPGPDDSPVPPDDGDEPPPPDDTDGGDGPDVTIYDGPVSGEGFKRQATRNMTAKEKKATRATRATRAAA